MVSGVRHNTCIPSKQAKRKKDMNITHTTAYGKEVELIEINGCIATVMFKSIVGFSFEEIHVTKIFEI